MKAELKDPYILLTDQKISNIQDMVPHAGGGHASSGRPLFIIAEDVEGEALATILLNKPARHPQLSWPSRPRASATAASASSRTSPSVTGGQVVDEGASASTIADATIEMLGTRQDRQGHQGHHHSSWTAPVTRTPSTSASTRSRTRSSAPTSDFDREKLQERLAKLSGGVAVHQGRCCHRVRAQGDQAPHRGRPAGHPRGRRGGHRRRRRRGVRGLPPLPLTASRPSTRTRRSASSIIRKALEAPVQQPSPTTLASRAPSWSRRSRPCPHGRGPRTAATGDLRRHDRDGRARPGEGRPHRRSRPPPPSPASSSSPRPPSPMSPRTPTSRTPSPPLRPRAARVAECTRPKAGIAE